MLEAFTEGRLYAQQIGDEWKAPREFRDMLHNSEWSQGFPMLCQTECSTTLIGAGLGTVFFLFVTVTEDPNINVPSVRNF